MDSWARRWNIGLRFDLVQEWPFRPARCGRNCPVAAEPYLDWRVKDSLVDSMFPLVVEEQPFRPVCHGRDCLVDAE